MNKQYKVTVIVPVYKVELFIEKCARSLFEQTLEEIEFIFVDDCGGDQSMQLLSQVLEQYPERVGDVRMLRHEVNKGSAAARNTGLSHATGEYIGWVDSDDWVDPAMFDRLYEAAVKSDADVVWCDFKEVFLERICVTDQYLEDETGRGQVKAIITGKFGGVLWNKIMRRSLLETNDIRFLDSCDMAEDQNFCVKVLCFADKVKYVSEPLYYYSHINTGSLVATAGPKQVSGQVGNTTDLLSFFNQYHIDWLTKEELTFFKLYSKERLLLSTDINDFIRWAEIFPETNYSILTYHKLLFRHRLLALFSIWGWWYPLRWWISLKKLRGREK